MMLKQHRLRKLSDVLRAVRSGHRRARSGPFSLTCGKNEGGVRFAVVVPTAVSKRATVRNRLRRRIREVLRALTPALPPSFCADCAIRAYPGAEKLSFSDVAAHIEKLLYHSV